MPSLDTKNIDWKNLPFGYVKTDFNIRYYYKEGKWSGGELYSEDTIDINIAAPALHYGQQAFEGLKAFNTKDGRIVVFRPEENAARINHSCERIKMPSIPEEMFLDALKKVVIANKSYIPPYGTGASLYIRPLVFGSGPKIGLGPASEYVFLMLVTPVGPYYKGGFKPVKALVLDHFDRAAPEGLGDCKVGGNYAAGLPGGEYAHDKGFPIVLYLDSKEKKYVDEFGTSNFIGIKGDKYITPKSCSILDSITNKSLSKIAEEYLGMTVERRPVSIDEVPGFDEIGAVGTAAVVTPVNELHFNDRIVKFGDSTCVGEKITKLYKTLTQLQYGEIEDKFGWLYEIK
ncbi:MAG TPA: branched-chain amino acid aminotransferase [Spirochaetota bacterium]|nr:branched-chain amino acid aminotransferase [Spirochaetota bacterium]